MKTGLYLLCGTLVALSTLRGDGEPKVNRSTPLITSAREIQAHLDQRVRLVGVYHDPGKGSCYINCGFLTFRIIDYSFKKKDSEGYLIPLIQDGEEVEVEALLRLWPGSQMTLEAWDKLHPLPVQEEASVYRTIDGVRCHVTPPEFNLSKGELIEVRKKQPNKPLQGTPAKAPSSSTEPEGRRS